MQLADFLDTDAIKTALPGANKRSLLQQLANLAGQRLESDPAAILAGLNEREQLGSTGFGQGVAIPHAGSTRSTASMGCSRALESRWITKRSTAGPSTSSSFSCRPAMRAPSI
jgi:phosphoenolpyruvate-dependent sugar phosphotransferase system EIIA component